MCVALTLATYDPDTFRIIVNLISFLFAPTPELREAGAHPFAASRLQRHVQQRVQGECDCAAVTSEHSEGKRMERGLTAHGKPCFTLQMGHVFTRSYSVSWLCVLVRVCRRCSSTTWIWP